MTWDAVELCNALARSRDVKRDDVERSRGTLSCDMRRSREVGRCDMIRSREKTEQKGDSYEAGPNPYPDGYNLHLGPSC